MLIVDLTDVEFLASAGIGLLIDVQRLTESSPVQMRVVAEGATTYRPLRILGVEQYLQIYPTVAQARTGRHEP
jgi:anti-sigma B factor antagonist